MNLSVRDIAYLLGVSEGQVRRWIQDGGLPATHILDGWLVHRAELFDWACGHGLAIPGRFFSRRGRIDAPTTFADALRRGRVVHVDGADQRSVARAIAASLALPAGVDEIAVEMMAARPDLGFLTTPHGVALPHLREPVIVDAPPTIGLTVLATPHPQLGARGILAVAAPTVHHHRVLVEDLHAALHDPAVRQAVGDGHLDWPVGRAEAA